MQKKTLFGLIMIFMLIVSLIPNVNAHADTTWNLVWSDEFNGSGINTSNWVFDTGTGSGGWGNNELEYYTNRPENARIENGNLLIEARKEAYGGMGYTSARMKTKGLRQFTYGKIEARMKLPKGQGIWPAFWMLGSNIDQVGWPKCGELDIMENVNNGSNIYGTIHWDKSGHQYYTGQSSTIDVTQYHVYSVEWDASSIKWFVDGVKYWEANITINDTEEFHRPFFILLNLAVGGQWPGSPDGTTEFPAKMYVDYVRVYQKGGTTPSTQVATPTFNLASGTYDSAQNVSISTATPGATIRYTTNGSEPNENSIQYTTPINVASTKTIKAKAFKVGLASSLTAVATYTIKSSGGTGNLPSTTWYLFNQKVAGVNTISENIQTGKSSVSGWQPIKAISTTQNVWTTPVTNGTYRNGNWNFTLWTNNPGGTSNVKVDLIKVNADGSGGVFLGSKIMNVSATGGGNHPTTYSYNLNSVSFNNQRLMVKVTKTSGVDAVMCYNTNDFPTRLVTP
jgi:beta-glucanase (GH16 family)